LAYGLFAVFLLETGRRYFDMYESMQIPVHGALRMLAQIGESIHLWGWIPPVLVLGAAWWIAAPDASIFRLDGPRWPLTWIPGFRSITKNYRYANFADLAALLIDHETPLHEALELSADAAGDRAIQLAVHPVAQNLIRGGEIGEASVPAGGLPPFLSWLITRGQNSGDLAKSLRRAGEMYRDRAKLRIEWLKFAFPILAGIVVGGGAVVLYALALFLPMVNMLRDLSLP
jgi:type II secretory pathway component PulF